MMHLTLVQFSKTPPFLCSIYNLCHEIIRNLSKLCVFGVTYIVESQYKSLRWTVEEHSKVPSQNFRLEKIKWKFWNFFSLGFAWQLDPKAADPKTADPKTVDLKTARPKNDVVSINWLSPNTPINGIAVQSGHLFQQEPFVIWIAILDISRPNVSFEYHVAEFMWMMLKSHFFTRFTTNMAQM